MPVRVAWYDSVITFTIAIDARGWSVTSERTVGDMAHCIESSERKHGGNHHDS